MSNLVDMKGLKFNKLLVLHRFDDPKYKHASWVCQCDCGKIVIVVGNNLRNGGTKSCGCSKGEYISKALSGLPSIYPLEYKTYNQMLQRCNNENSTNYQHYGGNGISVCQRWIDSFENFMSDMGPKPSFEHSIDREDFNGNYEPGNCRWATDKEQNRNRSNNIVITYRGLILLMVDWATAFNMDRRKLRDYLKYAKDFEDFLLRYGFKEQADRVLNNPFPFTVQPNGKYREFSGYRN